MSQQQRHGRRGAVFSVRLTDDERAAAEHLQTQVQGPRAELVTHIPPETLSRWRARGWVPPPRT